MKNLLASFLLLIGCNQNVINTPVRSFDRPSDVALVCAQRNPDDVEIIDVRPLADCNVERSQVFKHPAGCDDINVGCYYPTMRALVANSARGELALVEAVGVGGLVDLYPRTPGFGFLPVGKLPEHVRASDDGCKALTANVDSCDLSFVDVAEMNNLKQAEGGTDGGFRDGSVLNEPSYGDDVARRMVPTVNGKPLGARPTWVEFAPESKSGLHGYEPGGRPGTCTGGDYSAWVALPGCQLVVKVSLMGSQMDTTLRAVPAPVTAAVRVLRDRVEMVTDLSTLSCASECSGGPAFTPDLAAPADMAVGDGGVVRLPDSQAFPGSFALDFDRDRAGKPTGAGRMIIADQLSERLSIVPIEPNGGVLGTPRSLTLESGALGVQVVRASPRGPAGKFLYAVARDSSVRVVDLDRELECETQPDPRQFASLPPVDPFPAARKLGCFPLGDPATPPRSPLAIGPGIVLQNGALPKDIAFVHLDVAPPPIDGTLPSAQPGLVAGDFAWIIGSDGRASLVNIFDACPAPNEPYNVQGDGSQSYTHTCSTDNGDTSRARARGYAGRPEAREYERLSHRLRQARNRFYPVACGDSAGSPRLADETQPFSLTVNGMGVESGRPNNENVTIAYPTLEREVLPQPAGTTASCPNLRSVGFQEIDRVRNERWTLTWEGLLPGTLRPNGRPTFDGSKFKLFDAGASFCQRGVQRGDILVLVGCQADTECDYAQRCVRDPGAPPIVTSGMCLDKDDADQAAQCSPLVRAQRNFRVLSAKQGEPQPTGELSDVLELDEIAQPEHPAQYGPPTCASDDDCKNVKVATKDSNTNTVNLDTVCLDASTDASGAKIKRCVRACKPAEPGKEADIKTAGCGGDFQCAASHYGGTRCLRAPLDPKLFRAKSQGGYGCVRELQPYEVHAGEGFTLAGAQTGFLIAAQANPVTRECESPPVSSPFVRLRQSRIPIADLPACGGATNVRESIVPPTAPERNVCLYSTLTSGDRIIHFENIYFSFGLIVPSSQPVPLDRFALSFDIVGGGFPLTSQLAVDAIAQQPRAAVTSPDGQFVFIVDEGKATSAAGLRGQLLRLNSLTQSVDRSYVVR